jgi:hypothetical protein
MNMNLNILESEVRNAIRMIEQNPAKFSGTWEGLFKHSPQGEFKWDASEAGDWVYYEDDGEWYKRADSLNIGRTSDGTEWVEFASVDSDGNWDLDCRVSSKQGEPLSEHDLDEFQFWGAVTHPYYSLLHGYLYAIHVVRTGEDPLDDAFLGNDPVEVNLHYLQRQDGPMDLVESVKRTLQA